MKVKQFRHRDTALQFLETMMRYVFHANQQVTKEKFHDIIGYVEQHYSEGSDTVMTLAEILREEGKQEGREEGREALIRTSIQLITKFVAPVTDDLKQKINEQDMPALETIIAHIDKWESLEDIEKILK